MTSSSKQARYVIRMGDGWYYVAEAMSQEGPTICKEWWQAKAMIKSGAGLVKRLLENSPYELGTIEILPVAELEASKPPSRPKPVKPGPMDDEVLMLSLGLILAMHERDTRKIQTEIQDLYPRVPYQRREQLRRIVRHSQPAAVLRKLIEMYGTEDTTFE